MTDKNYRLKNLSFSKEDLDIITLDDLEREQVCPGHIIFLSSKFNKPVLLMRAGDFVDPDFIQRYKKKGQKSFYIYKVSNDENIQTFNQLWITLKTAKLETERLIARKKLLTHFCELFWFEQNKARVLDFYLSTFNTFNRFDDEIIVQLRETDTLLCERGIQAASFSSIVALILGYTDFQLLSDIFHVTFLLDLGLVEKNYSYFIAQACEQERQKPGEGLHFLKKMNVSKSEYSLFYYHPVESMKIAKKRCIGVFYHPDVIKIISYQHELFNGKGFPSKINYWGLSEYETIPILVDAFVPFEETFYTESSEAGIFKKYVESLNENTKAELLPLRKSLNRLTLELNKILIEENENESDDSQVKLGA